MPRPIDLPGWKALNAHQKELTTVYMRDLFERDPQRFDKFSLRFDELLLDFSKNRVTETTMGDRIEVGVEVVKAGTIETHRVRLDSRGVRELEKALASVGCRERPDEAIGGTE